MSGVGIGLSTTSGTIDLRDEVRTTRERFERERTELVMLIKQIHDEIDRLAPVANETTRRVREVDAHLESYARGDIRDAYVAAQDSQSRLISMQSRLEQLDYKQRLLDQQIALLTSVEARFREAPEPLPDVESVIPVAPTVQTGAIQAIEDDRKRLARYLNDGPAQVLAGLSLHVETCERLMTRDFERSRHELRAMRDLIAIDIGRLRRHIFELRPTVLEDLGLVPTLKRFAQILGDVANIKLDVTGRSDTRPGADVELSLFRICQEAIDNAARHGRATRIGVFTERVEGQLIVTVSDDGAGFQVASARGVGDSA